IGPALTVTVPAAIEVLAAPAALAPTTGGGNRTRTLYYAHDLRTAAAARRHGARGDRGVGGAGGARPHDRREHRSRILYVCDYLRHVRRSVRPRPGVECGHLCDDDDCECAGADDRRYRAEQYRG